MSIVPFPMVKPGNTHGLVRGPCAHGERGTISFHRVLERQMVGEKVLKVLLVEDSDSDAALLQRSLLQTRYEIRCERVETAEKFCAMLKHETWDIVIADFSLPQFDAPTALNLLRQQDLDTPFIVVSGQIGEETAVKMMKAGANDYLMKNNLPRLAPAIEREFRDAQARRKNRQSEALLKESESQYRAVTESAIDAILITNDKGLIVHSNRRAESMFGYEPFELQGQPLRRIVPFSERELMGNGTMASQELGGGLVGRTVEFHGICKDGRIFPMELSFAEWETAEGKFYSVIARDITERSQVQGQLQRQLEYLTTLRTIDSAMTESFDPHFTLNIILEQAIAHLGVDAAEILLVNPHSRRLEYAAVRGFLTNTYLQSLPDQNDGYAGRVFAERITVQIPNLRATPDGTSREMMFFEERFESYYGSPLITKGQVKGVLEVFRRSSLCPDGEWLTFLEALASQAAIAMDTIGLVMELQQTNADLALAYDATLEGWSRALDLRDKETEGHSLRVTEMSVRLALEMGLSEEAIAHLRRGAILHDIGKLGIPDRILLKPGELTEEERAIMRRHPVYSYAWLSPIVYLRAALDIPYCHHEKWDGSGYPRGLQGEAIPLAARIFSVVDVWDALRSERPYRAAWSFEKTREYISAMAGSHFDPKVVAVFLECLHSIVLPPDLPQVAERNIPRSTDVFEECSI
jgi:PAS domain S-box-containing protein